MTTRDGMPSLADELALMSVSPRIVSDERELLRRAVEALRRAEYFCEEAERAGSCRQSPGGQQVMPQGDFAYASPSIESRLKWWAREFRAMLSRPSAGGGE